MYDCLFTIAKPPLFEAASIVILCLLAVELASYLFFTRPFARLTEALKDIFKFKHPWDSIPFWHGCFWLFWLFCISITLLLSLLLS